MDVGKRIKLLRTEKGLSRKELFELSGVSESAIKQYETNKRQPQIEQLQKIADALNVSVSYLANVDRIVLDVRKDGPLNEDFIQRLLEASELNNATELFLTALGEYAVNHHGLEWLQTNKTKPEDSND